MDGFERVVYQSLGEHQEPGPLPSGGPRRRAARGWGGRVAGVLCPQNGQTLSRQLGDTWGSCHGRLSQSVPQVAARPALVSVSIGSQVCPGLREG